jgi:DNA-binding NarL/FixJ family response regulator
MHDLKILVVDDHPIVREGLRRLIDAQPGMTVVAEASDGRTAVTTAVDVKPDIVVMDVTLPELDGVQATRQLCATLPHVKVVALTVHEHPGYVEALLQAGAAGYVLKRAAAADLVQALRAVAAGGVYLDPSVAASVAHRAVHGRPVTRGPDLSEREAAVVRLIARGYSNKEIAARLGVSVKTVETHKARSLEKLGVQSRADLVRFALERGWLSATGDGENPDTPFRSSR